MIRKQFAGDIRQQVLESLIPKYLQKQFEAENLNVVGTPDITDVHFHDGEPLRFKAEFEVVPEIELRRIPGRRGPVPGPEVTDEDVDKRIEETPRAEGAVRQRRSAAARGRRLRGGGAREPRRASKASRSSRTRWCWRSAAPTRFPAFTENLRGLSPGDEKEFEVTYPEDYGSPRLAGKTVRFHATVKGMRRKELPELNDEFAQDLGDYRNVDELREAIRKAHLRASGSTRPSRKPRTRSSTSWWTRTISRCPRPSSSGRSGTAWSRACAPWPEQGVDPRTLKLDWEKVRETPARQGRCAR